MKPLCVHLFFYVLFHFIYLTLPRSILSEQVLIVVSYDGFKNDYFHRNVTSNLLEFRNKGVYVDYMENVFPTKTFTNHFSIATGLHPGTHGVTANSLYDSKLGSLKYGYDLFHYDHNILPIWTLNEKSGGTSGCMMWPGSDFEYSNITCTYTKKYNSSIPYEERVDVVMSWLKDLTNPPNLIMLYIEMPDKLAHAKGPDSDEITKMVNRLDNLTKYLQDQLYINNLASRANVIHLSDHGMEAVTPPYFINLTDFLEPDTYKIYGTSPVLQIVPLEGKEGEIYEKLKKTAAINGNFNVYNHETMPKRWRCRNKDRFGPIVAVANLGYAFQDMWESAEYYRKNYSVPITNSSSYGVHGYDNALPEMHPFFMAKGPLFKQGYKANPFSVVDLYTIFCKILNIDKLPATDGSYDKVSDILEGETGTGVGISGIFAIIAACVIIIILAVFAIRYFKRKQSYFFVI